MAFNITSAKAFALYNQSNRQEDDVNVCLSELIGFVHTGATNSFLLSCDRRRFLQLRQTKGTSVVYARFGARKFELTFGYRYASIARLKFSNLAVPRKHLNMNKTVF